MWVAERVLLHHQVTDCFTTKSPRTALPPRPQVTKNNRSECGSWCLCDLVVLLGSCRTTTCREKVPIEASRTTAQVTSAAARATKNCFTTKTPSHQELPK